MIREGYKMASVKDLGNNKYRVIISNGFDEKGKQKRFTKIIKANSLAAAKKLANTLEVDYKRNPPAVQTKEELTSITFAELVERWRRLKKPTLAPKTYENYEVILNNSLLPHFGGMKIKDITPLTVEEYLNLLRTQPNKFRGNKTKPLSTKTVYSYFAVLRRLLEIAVSWDLLEHNPCGKVDKPKPTEPAIASFYDDNDIKKLLKCLEIEEDSVNDKIKKMFEKKKDKDTEQKAAIKHLNFSMFKTYIILALSSGFRRSEMLGLEYSDFNLHNSTVTISRTNHYSPDLGLYTREVLKNGTAARTVPMPNSAMELVKSLYKEQLKCRKMMGSAWEKSDRVFISTKGSTVSQAGGPVNPDNISQAFERFLKKYNLPVMTLHGLRHSCVSFLLNRGFDISTVADRVGHKDVRVTQAIYNHIYDSNKLKCANAFDELFK